MLLAQSLVKLLQSWDSGLLADLSEDLIRERIPVVLSHILFRTLQLQQPDGSWTFNGKGLREVTAYAVLTLKPLCSLPWLAAFQSRVRAAIKRGSGYLVLNHDRCDEREYLWVAKVTYALPPLGRAYSIAAICAPTPHGWGDKTISLANLPTDRVRALAGFLSTLPMFCEHELWVLEGDATLGYLYQPRLSRVLSSGVFPPQTVVSNMKKGENKYLEYIPLTWIATNRRNRHALPNSMLWEMMVISVLVYQLDEFMEKVCNGEAGAQVSERLRETVRELCEFAPPGSTGDLSNGNEPTTNGNGGGTGALNHHDIRAALHRFTSHILQHPAVVRSPTHVREQLHGQLATCLLSHIDHAEASARLAGQGHKHAALSASFKFRPARGTYYSWVQSTGADTTQSPAIFLFFCCLAAAPGEPFFRGVRQHYLSSALSRHLANLCRQYNDYGSASRDLAEGNLNSLNFPEFHEMMMRGEHWAAAKRGTDPKTDLLFVAEYERECLEHAITRLSAVMGPREMDALRVFVDTVDLYGQIYAARDISNHVRGNQIPN
jgi:hypothetical protein